MKKVMVVNQESTSRAAAPREDLLQAESVTPMILLTPHIYPEQLP